MIEIVMGVVIFLLAALGLGIGLLLTGRPPQTACGGMACQKGGRCAGCPNAEDGERADG